MALSFAPYLSHTRISVPKEGDVDLVSHVGSAEPFPFWHGTIRAVWPSADTQIRLYGLRSGPINQKMKHYQYLIH